MSIGWLLALALASFPAHASKRVALVIGVSNYAKAPLKNLINDACAIVKRLAAL